MQTWDFWCWNTFESSTCFFWRPNGVSQTSNLMNSGTTNPEGFWTLAPQVRRKKPSPNMIWGLLGNRPMKTPVTTTGCVQCWAKGLQQDLAARCNWFSGSWSTPQQDEQKIWAVPNTTTCSMNVSIVLLIWHTSHWRTCKTVTLHTKTKCRQIACPLCWGKHVRTLPHWIQWSLLAGFRFGRRDKKWQYAVEPTHELNGLNRNSWRLIVFDCLLLPMVSWCLLPSLFHSAHHGLFLHRLLPTCLQTTLEQLHQSGHRLNHFQLVLRGGCVTSTSWISPAHHISICQHSNKRPFGRMNLPNIPQLIFHPTGISAGAGIAPGHHWFVFQNCSKCTRGWLNLPHFGQTVLDGGAIASTLWIAPGNDGSVCQNGSKSGSGGLDLPYILQLILDFAWVPTILWIFPSNYPAAFQDSSKGTFCALNLRDTTNLIFNSSAPKTIPRDNSPVCDGCKSKTIGLDLLHTYELVCHRAAIATTSRMAPCNYWSVC